MPQIRIEMDEPAHELLLRVKRTITERNDERVRQGVFDQHEQSSFKAILQRGVAVLAKELEPSDTI